MGGAISLARSKTGPAGEAAKREATVPRLIRDLLDVIAADGPTTAILDDAGPNAGSDPD